MKGGILLHFLLHFVLFLVGPDHCVSCNGGFRIQYFLHSLKIILGASHPQKGAETFSLDVAQLRGLECPTLNPGTAVVFVRQPSFS